MVWLDLEMTGLNVSENRIIEIAVIVTDSQLNVLSEGPVIAIKQSESCLAAMGEWCTKTHTETGLVDRVRQSSINEEQAEQLVLDSLAKWVPEKRTPLCGSSPSYDRQFLQRYMPKLASFFHYRSIDVSTVAELARLWKPTIFSGYKKRSAHRALDDIRGSIEELKYYRKHFIRA